MGKEAFWWVLTLTVLTLLSIQQVFDEEFMFAIAGCKYVTNEWEHKRMWAFNPHTHTTCLYAVDLTNSGGVAPCITCGALGWLSLGGCSGHYCQCSIIVLHWGGEKHIASFYHSSPFRINMYWQSCLALQVGVLIEEPFPILPLDRMCAKARENIQELAHLQVRAQDHLRKKAVKPKCNVTNGVTRLWRIKLIFLVSLSPSRISESWGLPAMKLLQHIIRFCLHATQPCCHAYTSTVSRDRHLLKLYVCLHFPVVIWILNSLSEPWVQLAHYTFICYSLGIVLVCTHGVPFIAEGWKCKCRRSRNEPCKALKFVARPDT